MRNVNNIIETGKWLGAAKGLGEGQVSIRHLSGSVLVMQDESILTLCYTMYLDVALTMSYSYKC